MKHTISVIVENKPGVLHRVAGLFSRRGFNIESLAVGTTDKPETSRMTIVVEGDDQVLEQITKQLYKVIPVLKVYDIPRDEVLERELALIKVKAGEKDRAEIAQVAELLGAKIAHAEENSIILEICAEKEKVDELEKLLNKFGILELVRTGKAALQRGSSS